MSGKPAAGSSRQGVLDTSTLILLQRITDPDTLPLEPLITTVTLAELSVGPHVVDDPRERAARQAHLQLAEADFVPLPFDVHAARAFGQVASSLRRAGRKTSARAYDAMIAAIAIAHGLPVYTCNPGDFAGIEGLRVVSVPIPMHVELLFWSGCPSHPKALSELRQAMSELGLHAQTVEVREIETEEQARRERFVGSPTIRIDSADIRPPGQNEPYGLTCRVYHRRDGRISPTPDPADVHEALARHDHRKEPS